MIPHKAFLGVTFSLAMIVSIGCSPNPTTTKSQLQKTSSVKEGSLIKQPGETGEEGKIYVVKDGKRHWITHSSWIGAHSTEFPGGVQTISANELEAVPQGDPITAER